MNRACLLSLGHWLDLNTEIIPKCVFSHSCHQSALNIQSVLCTESLSGNRGEVDSLGVEQIHHLLTE